MYRLRALTAPLLAAALLAGCGGTSTHQHVYHTRFGVQAHSPTFGLPPKGSLPKAVAPTSQPTLLMLDSVDSSLSIFSGLNPTVTAGYTSGSWPTFFDYRGHFPYVVAVMVNTSHFGEHGAAISCLDVEPGDATPSEAGPWLRTEAQRGFRPCAYGSLSEWPAINQSIAAAHVPGHVFRWDADWTYSQHIDSGFDATQWTDHFANRNIDGSTVTYAFVGKGVKPPPPPKPKHICFGVHWQHTKLCNHVRQLDAVLGRERNQQLAFLKVSNANIARIEKQLGAVQGHAKAEQAKASALNAQLVKSLHTYGFHK